jgi:hypothetical protein
LDRDIDDYMEEQYRKKKGYPPEDLWDTPPPELELREGGATMTPGEAGRQVQAVLRANGYGVDELKAKAEGTTVSVVGTISTLEGAPRGAFTAVVMNDSFVIDGGAFGRITEKGVDPFHEL